VSMGQEQALVVFADTKIRKIWFNEEWFYSVVDIVEVLSESPTPRQYWGKVKDREFVQLELSPIWVQLKLPSSDGKSYETDCVNTKNAFRLVQSIPSKKAEPFKMWLAQLAKERIEEIENPELAQDRVKEYYELKGYPKEWIDKRLRGIAIRQELTEEWKQRGVEEQREFAILTNEISKATFGKTVGEYKEFKGLQKPNQNLRDHMSDWELILTMVGEKATTDITVAKNAQGVPELKQTAKEGGDIAKNTRRELEQKIGKSIVTPENYVHLSEQKQRKKLIEDKK